MNHLPSTKYALLGYRIPHDPKDAHPRLFAERLPPISDPWILNSSVCNTLYHVATRNRMVMKMTFDDYRIDLDDILIHFPALHTVFRKGLARDKITLTLLNIYCYLVTAPNAYKPLQHITTSNILFYYANGSQPESHLHKYTGGKLGRCFS